MIRASLSMLLRYARLTLGRSEPADDAQRRFVSVARGASSALVTRGVGILTGFLLVPVAVRYLGAERYGAWVTIGSAITWLSVGDLGLANGLTHALSDARGRKQGQLSREVVATSIWSLAAISLASAVVFAAVWPRIDWAAALNLTPRIRPEVGRSVGLAVLFAFAALPLSLLERIYASQEEGALANVWGAIASVVTLVAVLAATRTGGGLVAVVTASSGGRLAVLALNAVWLFLFHRPELKPRLAAVAPSTLRLLLRSGGLFFVVQLAALLLFNTDNIIIARVLGPGAVTPYAVSWALFTIPSMGIALAFPYLWPAYTEALARRDLPWVQRTFRWSLFLSIGSAALLALPLSLFGKPLIGLWAGKVAVPSAALLGWMALWSVVLAGMNALACLLNAARQVTGQAIYGTATAVLNVVLSFLWAHSYGATGVIAATVVAFLICGVIPGSIEIAWLFSRLRVTCASL